MSNSLGKVFTVTSFGESHGEMVGLSLTAAPPAFRFAKQTFNPTSNGADRGKLNFFPT